MKRLAVRPQPVRCEPLTSTNFTAGFTRVAAAFRPAGHQDLSRCLRESKTITRAAGRGVVLPPNLATRRSRVGPLSLRAIVVFAAVRVTACHQLQSGRTAKGGTQGTDRLSERRSDHFVSHGPGLDNEREVAAVRKADLGAAIEELEASLRKKAAA